MLKEELQKEIFFPYDNVRKIQANMIEDVHNTIKSKNHIIMHAPTGVGKTVSALAPALSYAIKNNMTIFFLTSRQTQHRIVVDTLKQIKKRFDLKFESSDIIGKKWMCLQNGVEAMPSSSFHEYCRDLREKGQCEFFLKTKKATSQPTAEAKIVLEGMKNAGPCHVQELLQIGRKNTMCPYELATLSSENARVVIADYYYIFNESIRTAFLLKTKKNLENCILIVDEAHNLPTRIREMMTDRLSSQTIDYAKREARKFGFDALSLEIVENALFELGKEIETEATVSKNKFFDLISRKKDYNAVIAELTFNGENIRDLQKKSFVLNVAKFLTSWLGPDMGFGRILTKSLDKNLKIDLAYRCLDPSLAAKSVIERTHSTVLMSGTLTPTSMYRDLLGFKDNIIEKEYKSPFPKKNRLALIIPKTTTKFVERSSRQFSEIASVCNEIVGNVSGSVAIFYPSYDLMEQINAYFSRICKKPVFKEKQQMKKAEKEVLLESFKKYKDIGAVLMGIATGSYGEGIDMPGVLKAVIVVGLPLNRPDVEAKLLIEYYEDKFGKGFEYGYVLPAMTKCMQNAGRCIRSETDKGAIILLDERYANRNYYECFPSEWEIEVEQDYVSALKEFFKN